MALKEMKDLRRKNFFFEKKKQKTFECCRGLANGFR